MKWSLLYCLLLSARLAQGQSSAAIIHSHNDYAGAEPFYGAIQYGAGSIEADIFLKKDKLLVGHTLADLSPGKTLQSLYLIPLKKEIAKNSGFVFPDRHPLNLLIDLKTPGDKTLPVLVDVLQDFPEITQCNCIQLTISGNVPDTSEWKKYPLYIHFDGRPSLQYNTKQLSRISMISDNLRNYTVWDGRTPIGQIDRNKLTALVQVVHDKGKKLRFWNSADRPEVWKELMSLKVDYVGTDHVKDLATFLATGSAD